MSGPVTIASIVEGDGEVSALPVLLRRIAGALSRWDVRISPPRRVPRSGLVARGGVENAVLRASYQLTGAGGILLLIDSDDDCPAALGPRLLETSNGFCWEGRDLPEASNSVPCAGVLAGMRSWGSLGRLVVVAVLLGLLVAGGVWWALTAVGEALWSDIPIFHPFPDGGL
ncbi:hypothetical protein [Streptosporangium sp. NPDC020145]|uniref:hypothetical protein n=1 Tax=Streptosporangium sp. NPDC020145 TaxID=3154694 RepID=UPI0034215D0B